MSGLLSRLGVRLPIIQAPMAGTSTPQLAAAVTEAGGLGSIALGAVDAAAGREMIAAVRRGTNGPFNVNLFCHRPARSDPTLNAGWLAALAPTFASFGAAPPAAISEIYTSFAADAEMLAMLEETRPPVVSFHFGLPPAAAIARLKSTGALLLATATSLAEAQASVAAGVDAVVAQGWEAGGHRGVFEPGAPDGRLGVAVLTRLLVKQVPVPIIAAGGLMDGAAVAGVLALGAQAAQLGTAFVACPESSADSYHRDALMGPGAVATEMTDLISGRPARCLPNAFTALSETLQATPRPDYPIAYDAGKALAAAARARGDGRYGAQWAGQGAPLARALPAAALMAALERELELARRPS
ncbi:nitronate monooxygenase family protein [Caulobacter sp. 602-1]|uniref:NAD(P)H-dependent flavin oxidoreductase n=1 Tax=Caulobacter sp. 602-1 TaxID=2492472 RepID=UPI000F641F08|nr:nitronate monooxygenase [Caulobacter sp. 602-1]RRN63983.1 nitronate monooxygenase [Caulobacter sp. 602-1]